MTSNPDFYKEFPKTRAADDFWGQVARTVNGKVVGEDQIALIVAAIKTGLAIAPDDVLLDLCCGNGALSDRIFEACQGGQGVDFSAYLIGVAHTHFERAPHRLYLLADVEEHVCSTTDTERFTKALCYGSLQYLPADKAASLLRCLRLRFPQLTRVFIGNLPDKALMQEFFSGRPYHAGQESDPHSQIGIWRTREEFVALARDAGWRASFTKMPKSFYAAHYRYDAVLEPM